MMILNNAVITTAGTFTGPTYQLREPAGHGPPMFLGFQETFTFGSGAAVTADVYIQTSFDGGLTWCDAIHFAQLTTASARFIAAVGQAGVGPAVAATDGTQTVNTVTAGMFGSWWRTKYITTGTYGGNTTLRVDAIGNVMLVPAGINAFN